MNGISLRALAHALGGEVSAGQVSAPGPNHPKNDRSMSIRLSPGSPDGFLTHSFAGDSFQSCKDYVKSRLGIERVTPDADRWTARPAPKVATDDKRAQIERAMAIWHGAHDPRGTLVEKYLASRGLELPADVAGAVLRYHAACPWREPEGLVRVPAMLALLRDVRTDRPCGIHRTRLTADGAKVARRMLGVAAASAVKLDADEIVTIGLHLCEGVETGLAARQIGLRPVWAMGSAGSIAAFPTLGGIECLTILAEHDAASSRAVAECADRWHQAGREVVVNLPRRGKDIADAIGAPT